MTDFQAALLISQLGKLERFKKRRKEIVDYYDSELKNVDGIIIQKEIEQSDTCRHLYIIRLDENVLSCTRREFFDEMGSRGVQPQVHYVPVYWFPYYQELGYKKGLCQNAERIYKGIMSIPLYPSLTEEETEYVVDVIKTIVEKYKR